jgi:acyl-CoA thioesterase
MSLSHPFDEALRMTPLGGGRFAGHTHPGYANMVGPFGGVTAAQMLQAVLLHDELLGEPTALTVNFCAAVADGPFEVHAQPVRTNRSTQHWWLTLTQGAEPVITATAVTAKRRETLRAQDSGMPQVPAASEVPPMSGKPPVAWIERYDIRYVRGGLPQTWDDRDAGDSHSLVWMSDSQPRPLDLPALTAYADVFFPRLWLRRARRVPIGTVSMGVYFHASAQDLAACGQGFVLGSAHAHVMHDGFQDQTGVLWSADGRCLASTHQTMYYRE